MTAPAVGMQVRIHRGTHEIGGSCVELRCAGSTILLDLGRPLWAARDEPVPMPNAIGLSEPGPDPLAVVVSHGHQDHWGLVPDLPRPVPVWTGAGAADVLRAAQFWGTGVDLGETGHLQDRVPIRFGPFTVTPYAVDHSGYDAYALLVDAGGRRLLYSGDLRGHGRKHALFTRLLADPPNGVDVLLLEGTNLRAQPDDDAIPDGGAASESAVEADLADTLCATPGLAVVLASAQNVDRLVTVYRAARRARRRLGIDLYTADVAVATGRATIPHIGDDWPQVSAYLPLRQRVQVKQSGQFSRTAAVRGRRVFDADLAADPRGWVLFGAYQSHVRHLADSGLLTGGVVVWSLWDGYLAQPAVHAMRASLAAAGVGFVQHHCSGHATVPDLQRLVDAVAPTRIVPIHTEAPDRFPATFSRPVSALDDGSWWAV